MTDSNTPKGRGRPKKEKSSVEAEQLFPDYIPSEERSNKTEHDVDDLFAHIDEEDLRSHRSHQKMNKAFEYAKLEETKTQLNASSDDINAEPHKTITSPNMNKNPNLDDLIRAEEIAAEIVRTKGRFIEGVDNAKPGVTFRGPDASINPALLDGIEYNSPANPKQFIEKPKYEMRSDGITMKGVLDTGIGAQEAVPSVNERDDPSSLNFMVCVNQECRYREHCMRYRMKNKRNMKASFYPEDCRRDGIYMNIEDSEFTAYDPFNILESKSTPSF